MKKRMLRFSAIMTAAAIMYSSVPLSVDADGTREVNISTTEQLLDALADAKPGDKLILAPGTYQNDVWKGNWAAFFSESSGTAEQPITICSADPDDPAVLCGVSQENKIALHIMGEYWNIENIVACEAAKGIILDKGSNSNIIGCEVYNTGTEGIHLRDDTSNCLIENCYIHDCGTVSPQYGEGIYIGSAKGTTEYGFDCHYNTVRNCRISNVGADCIDIKEYTLGALVEDCIFDGSGIKGLNGADSFIEVKGNNVIVRNNIGYQNGNEKVLYAVDLYMAVDGWGQNSRIYDNKFYMDSEDIPLVKGWNCVSYAFRNESEPVCPAVTGNKVADVLDISMSGDTNADGLVDLTDVSALQRFLLGDPAKGWLSWKNADLCEDGRLDAYDMCMLRKLMASGKSSEAKIYVNYNAEDTGKWRFTDGLGGRTLYVRLKAGPENSMNIGWGYWDPNFLNEDTGKSGKWIQLSIDKVTLDAQGEAVLTLELPESVTRADVEVWDYMDSSGKLDKSTVELTEAWFID